MIQIIISTLFLLIGALLVFIFFKSRLAKNYRDLSSKVDKLIFTLFPDKKTIVGKGSSGIFADFTILGNRLEEITITGKPINTPRTGDEKQPDHSKDDFKKRYDNLLIINELGQRVTSSLKLEDTFDHLYQTINSVMDASIFELGMYSWRDAHWKIISNIPINQVLNSEYHNHIAEWSLGNNREVILNDAEADYERYVNRPLVLSDGRKPKSIICFPVYREGREVGTLCVMSFAKNAYTDYHLEMMRSLIPYTAVAIGNSLIHQELVSTQEQLIHNEKLASIGQLTSGIAHEILNPLNFVNNFSELSKELLEEFENTTSIDDQNELKVQLISNLDKIHQHGNRAYSIVKNMMMLSRTGDGKKTMVNINKLVEEFLSIAFQGFRMKVKDFECQIEKSLEPKLPAKEMVSEDFGRVLLNLFTNAFYTMNEKRKKLAATENEHLNKYSPELVVKTFVKNSMIIITVKDNGAGIPDEIKSKIFLPFFTTKPTGDGTGLGLSLSHDIINKGNGGDLSVASEIGKGSEFKITLPFNSNH